MRILIGREQIEETDRKGRLKGIKFKLTYKLDCTDEELAFIDRYSLEYRVTIDSLLPSDATKSVKNLIAGGTVVENSAWLAWQREAWVRKACQDVAAEVHRIKSFKGESIIDLDAESTTE